MISILYYPKKIINISGIFFFLPRDFYRGDGPIPMKYNSRNSRFRCDLHIVNQHDNVYIICNIICIIFLYSFKKSDRPRKSAMSYNSISGQMSF